ncbi:MAG: zinc finger Ran-binding domain-containing protein [Candidatus Thorarchaeota archaeon]
MGKQLKSLFIVGIILLLGGVAVILTYTFATSKVVWTTKASQIGTNSSATLTSGNYIFGADYKFVYVEEGTMSITITIENSATTESHIINLSISPQSSNVETRSDGEVVEIAGGTYDISFVCNSSHFNAGSCTFRIIKPGPLRNLNDPVGTLRDNVEDKLERASEYSFIAIGLGGFLIFLAFLLWLITRGQKNKQVPGNQFQTQTYYQTQQPLPPPPPTYSTPQWQQQPVTSQPVYNNTQPQSNFWTCPYCNAMNSIRDNHCVICNREKGT